MVYQFSYLVRDEEVFLQSYTIWTFDAQCINSEFVVFSEREERGGGGEEREDNSWEESIHFLLLS